MTLRKKEGLRLLTQQMQKTVGELWHELCFSEGGLPVRGGLMLRDGTDDYGINIASDPSLQTLIGKIYQGFIPAFSQQVWTKLQFKTATEEYKMIEEEAINRHANKVVSDYAITAYRRLYSYLQPKFPDSDPVQVRDKAYKLLGSIIGRALAAFKLALDKIAPEYREHQIGAFVDDEEIEPYHILQQSADSRGRS